MNKYILNIEDMLVGMEVIISKYNVVPQGLRFVPGRRAPLYDSSNLDECQNKVISPTPYYPYLSAYIVRDLFYLYIMNRNEHKNLFSKNPMVPENNVKVYYNEHDLGTTVDGVIAHYIPNITIADLDAMNNLVSYSVDELWCIVKRSRNSIYEIDVETKNFVVIQKEDIRALRFQEAADIIEVERECNECPR